MGDPSKKLICMLIVARPKKDSMCVSRHRDGGDASAAERFSFGDVEKLNVSPTNGWKSGLGFWGVRRASLPVSLGDGI
jgi:hypothetical protein